MIVCTLFLLIFLSSISITVSSKSILKISLLIERSHHLQNLLLVLATDHQQMLHLMQYHTMIKTIFVFVQFYLLAIIVVV